MDRCNKFSSIRQGVIKLVYNPKATTGLRPRLRVENCIGYIDIYVTNVTFTHEQFELAAEALYSTWEREIRETAIILAPHYLPEELKRLNESELMALLGMVTDNEKIHGMSII